MGHIQLLRNVDVWPVLAYKAWWVKSDLEEENRDVCVQLSRTKLSLSWPTVESSGGSGAFAWIRGNIPNFVPIIQLIYCRKSEK